jgi:4-alpha-glucanotransferase
MKFPRSSGILLHITSLPGRFGIGDLGPSAYEFADFLVSAGQKLWQVLPLNPTGYADSPYQCFSAFAGNHLLLSFERLREAGILEASDLVSVPFPESSVDYGRVIDFKLRALRRAAQVFFADASRPDRAAFERFSENSASWLDDYALFMACKDVRPENTWATWDALAVNGYRWWIERLQASLNLFDMVRLDHFRGFEAYWEIPAGDTTAANGRWMKGPGEEFLLGLQNALGELPIVAENLGVITPAVEKLRRQFGLPGMSLLQFAFGNDPQGPSFRPHNYSRDLVAYTGGHDNDTTVGWWSSSGAGDSTRTSEDVRKEHEFASAYLDLRDEAEIHWVMIRTVLSSIADIAIIPLQDVLGLGSGARMNLPGTTSGNWKWRYRHDVLTDTLAAKLQSLTKLYDRMAK